MLPVKVSTLQPRPVLIEMRYAQFMCSTVGGPIFFFFHFEIGNISVPNAYTNRFTLLEIIIMAFRYRLAIFLCILNEIFEIFKRKKLSIHRESNLSPFSYLNGALPITPLSTM